MIRTASARWQGGLKDGTGTLDSSSGVLKETAYSFHTRFEDGAGTNPEELVAAAHAGCFSMALSAQLGQAGFTAKEIRTEARLSFEKLEAGFTITRIQLICRASVPEASPEAFQAAAQKAKAGCPVSRALNAEISLDAELV